MCSSLSWIHQPRLGTRFCGQPGRLRCRVRRINHPTKIRINHFTLRRIKTCSSQHVQHSRFLRNSYLAFVHFLPALFMPVGTLILDRQFTSTRHEWLQILVITGHAQALNSRVVGKADHFVCALSQRYHFAFGVIAEYSRRCSPVFGSGQNGGCGVSGSAILKETKGAIRFKLVAPLLFC